jgi:hypothetical protein
MGWIRALWYFGFYGSIVFLTVGMLYKPDTGCVCEHGLQIKLMCCISSISYRYRLYHLSYLTERPPSDNSYTLPPYAGLPLFAL